MLTTARTVKKVTAFTLTAYASCTSLAHANEAPAKYTEDALYYSHEEWDNTNGVNDKTARDVAQIPTNEVNELVVEELVIRAKNILGINKNEVSKFVGLSRMTLDRHVKGSAIKDATMDRYKILASIIISVEKSYGESLAPYASNIIIDGTTFKKHLLNAKDVSQINDVASLLAKKMDTVSVKSKDTSGKDFVNTLRVSRIG